jgi:hypothetical protein
MLTQQIFSADIEEALKNGRSKKEVNWTITLAHHLLQQLAVNQTYVIDNENNGRPKRQRCPCCEQPITGRYRDTSIGKPIIILYSLPPTHTCNKDVSGYNVLESAVSFVRLSVWSSGFGSRGYNLKNIGGINLKLYS